MLKIAYDTCYEYTLPEGHRFPMAKYVRLPALLLEEGTLTQAHFFSPQPLSDEIILKTHTPGYLNKLVSLNLTRDEVRKIGLPLTQTLVSRGRRISGGTLACCHYAFEYGISLNIAGGTHHAYADHGEGFCLFNDFAIAANELLKQQRVSQILVVDLDVHQGNGTAHIFQSCDQVFTFSMHGEKNYPLRKENSNLDIGLPDRTEGEIYLQKLEDTLPRLLDQLEPDLVLYLAGVDVLETDALGRLALSIEACKRRDALVFELCMSRQVPVAVSMGGGYSKDLNIILEAHANTFRLARQYQQFYLKN